MSDNQPTLFTLIASAAIQPEAMALPQNKAIEEMKKLIEAGADLNALDQYGGTALIDACDRGLETIALYLIEAGTDATLKETTFKRTALHFAAEHALYDVVEKLIAAGLDVNHAGKKGMTPLFVCCANAHNERLMNMKVTDSKGNEVKDDPRVLRAEQHYKNFGRVAKLLIERGADVDIALPDMKQTAIFTLCSFADEELIEILLAANAKVDIVDKFGNISLHYAARSGSPVVLKALIEKGANVNAQGGYGYTPLMEAIMAKKIDGVKTLLDAGADRMLALTEDYDKHKTGNNAIDIAIADGTDEILKLVSTD